MEIIAISIAALLASALTLFSGFGLGTLLMPVVAIFFPIEIAIAMTAMVHLANNLFKLALIGKKAKPSVLLRFGIPAVISAFVGAIILAWLSTAPSIIEYVAFGKIRHISPLNLIVGLLILAFVTLEMSPKFSSVSLNKKYLPLGGVISGFFGGLSGHQGAFRSMFLLKSGLTKEAFIATGVVVAVMVDVSRMLIYGLDISLQQHNIEWSLVIAASISAFVGAYLGAKLIKKVTIKSIQLTVSALLIIVSLGLMSGVL